MRFVAKAPSAGSTQRQATGLGRIFRGAVATRGAAPAFDGSGAPSRGRRRTARPLLASLALILTLAFSTSSASAAMTSIFDFGSLGAEGGQLNAARGIAVNETGNGGVPAGTIYVAENANFRIQRLQPDNNGTPANSTDDTLKFVSVWGWDVIGLGKANDTGAGFEICDTNAVVPNAPSDCQAGLAGGGAGQFTTNSLAGGIAVDQSTGNVYVVDRANFRVQVFDATGDFIRTWGADVELPAGGAAFENCSVAANCKAGVTGGAAGAFSYGGGFPGVGTDSAGNVYVTDNRRVQKFGPTGDFLAAGGWDVDSVNPSTEYEVCTVAANCKLGAAGSGLGQFGTNGLPYFLAVGKDGDVYAVGRTDGTIYHLTSGLAFDQAYAVTSGGAPLPNRNAIAVSWAGPDVGHVFFSRLSPTDKSSTIYELDPETGTIVGEHPGDASYTVGADGNEWIGLAIDSVNGRMYGARTATASFIRAFEEGPPTATIADATNNTGTRATLNGSVNPGGAAVDECFFEYGKTTSYGQTIPCVPSAASIGTGSSPVAVNADIAGLVPNGTTYHFRLVASNAKGSSKTSDKSFTTPAAVIATAATAVDGSSATLNGTVNPDTVALTECVFEYGTSTAYGQTVPCAETPASLGAGTSSVPVHADIVDLNPGTTYHFRLKAAYGGGIGPVLSDDLTLQTLGPRILETWSEEVVLTEAFLKAEIDPEGLPTTYRFEYGKTPAYGQETPELAVGSDSNAHKVSRFLEGLEPGTTYHYRVVATNADATNEGPDRTLSTFSPFVAATDCPNQAVRVGPSAALSDCRAYEMVSPIDKNGGDIETPEEETGQGSAYASSYRQASVVGGKITYSSATAFADSLGGHWSNQYLSSRGPDGWSTDAISSPRGTTVTELDGLNLRWFAYSFFQGFTPDLSTAWVRDNNVDPLTPDALQGYVNLYRRDNVASSYEALTFQGPFGPNATVDLSEEGGSNLGSVRVVGYSSDMRHQVFAASAALTPDANEAKSNSGPGGVSQLYDLVDGELHLVSVLPNGQAAPQRSFAGRENDNALVRTRRQRLKNAVSDDGSRIFWTARASFFERIYLRENPGEEQSALNGANECTEPAKACTIPVSESVSADQSEFWAAAADGSKAIFSQGDSPNRTLYLFDVETRTATEIAKGSRGVVATAEDLSHIYFTSTEAKAPGAVAGQINLYDYHGGDYTLLGVLTSDDVTAVSILLGGFNRPGASLGGPSGEPIRNQTRVTPDGRHFVFMSNSPGLAQASAGYDNTDVVTGKPDFEVYRYDAGAEGLTCVSCNPSGARPRGHLDRVSYAPVDTEFSNFPDRRVASSIPPHEHDNYASRILSDDGQRLFFHSDQALLPRDTNGVQDVYLWQAPGTGECEVGDTDYFPQNDGCIYLISTGRDDAKSEFVDATPDGSEVYISVDESIDPRDPGLRDIYVAKIGGGYPMPTEDALCEGEACQSPPAPPDDPTPNSLSFQGPGNPAPQGGKPKARRCPKGKRRVKARGGKTRCVKRQRSAKRAKAKRAKRANNNRRASR